jgi:hypothetical protein
MAIYSDHPLREFFEELVRRHFYHGADVHDSRVVSYIGGVLTDFTHTDRLYQIRNARGRRLDEVADMLVESNPILDASSFDRERAVRKHIGDFTLFFAGFFPEAIASLPRIHPLSVDTFVDYVAAARNRTPSSRRSTCSSTAKKRRSSSVCQSASRSAWTDCISSSARSTSSVSCRSSRPTAS